MVQKLRTVVAFTLGVLMGAVVTMPTGAAHAEGEVVYTWPTRTVGVYAMNHLGPRWRIDDAMRLWSAQGAVRLYWASAPGPNVITIRATSPYVANIYGDMTEKWSGLAHPELADPWPDDDDGDGINDTLYLTSCRVDVQRSGIQNPRTVEWRSHVMIHEIGHCLGLPHIDDHPRSVMSSFPSKYTNVPIQYEYDLLAQAYAGVPQ